MVVSNQRREVVAGSKLLIQYLRGRNLILSSGAELHSQLRGPKDVENIGGLLSLSKLAASKAMGENCMSLLDHAYKRRLKYIPVEIMESTSWKSRYDNVLLLVLNKSICY